MAVITGSGGRLQTEWVAAFTGIRSLVLDQNYTRAEAARSLGLNSNMLGRWVAEQQSDSGQAFRGNGKLTPDQEEIRKLKSQVKNLEMTG